MCCTFGDLTDVQWWRELQLPTRSIIQRNGRIQAETPEWVQTKAGQAVFASREAGHAVAARFQHDFSVGKGLLVIVYTQNCALWFH